MNINRFFVYELLHINLWLTFFLYRRILRLNITSRALISKISKQHFMSRLSLFSTVKRVFFSLYSWSNSFSFIQMSHYLVFFSKNSFWFILKSHWLSFHFKCNRHSDVNWFYSESQLNHYCTFITSFLQ